MTQETLNQAIAYRNFEYGSAVVAGASLLTAALLPVMLLKRCSLVKTLALGVLSEAVQGGGLYGC